MAGDIVILAFPKINHERNYVYSWMPFSTLAIAKVLRDDDLCEVVMFDGNEDGPQRWEAILDQYLDRAIFIGFSVMTGGGQIGHGLDLARIVRDRRPDVPLVWGGPHINVLPAETLEHPLADVVLQGPGQTSVPAYVRALQGTGALSDVPGIRTCQKGVIVTGPINPPATTRLARYPWDLLDLHRYLRDDPTVSARTLNYVSSQGCAYTCRFCYELVYNRKWSSISADDLLDDIEDLQCRVALNGIKFYDADFFINLDRVEAFCDGLVSRGIAIKWAASINPRDVLRARAKRPLLLEKLARSGCTRLLMGVESGADRVLTEIVDKRVTRADILDVAAAIAHAGLLGSYTFIVGFPGETADEKAQTYSLIEELRQLSPTPETRVHIFAPYPGTPLYEEAVALGYVPPSDFEAWSHYDYYESQTPWTNAQTASEARGATRMRLAAVGPS